MIAPLFCFVISMSRKKPSRSKKKSTKAIKPKHFRWFSTLIKLLFVLSLLAIPFIIYLDNQIRSEFDGKKWALPAKVFSRSLTLYPDLPLSQTQLIEELERTDYKRVGQITQPGEYSVYANQVDLYRRAFQFWDTQENSKKLRIIFDGNSLSRIYHLNQEQALIRLEPQYIGGIFPAHNEDRELIELKDVSPFLIRGLIATEDRLFPEHIGISFRGIARAMMANIKARRFVQGGSTLTQQLIKNFFLTNERTLSRKLIEAIMAVLLEYHYPKEAILQAYMNEVYLGQAGRRAIHGFGLAARFYFGKSAAELQLHEMAMLIGLVKGASYYNPKRNPERAKKRRDLVLEIMEEQAIISQAQRIHAQNQPLYTASPQRAGQREYPAFLQLVRQQLQKEYRIKDLQQEGLRIFTTLDPALQKALETSASQRLVQMESWNTKFKNRLEVAAIVTSVDGAEIRAMLGSRKAEFFGYNRALQARRSIGSLVKPFVYLTALESGQYHWGSMIEDTPITLESPPGKLWKPQNYNRKSHGSVSLLEAMSRSYNQATVRLGTQLGLNKVINTLHRLGITQDIPAYPSMLLGSFELTPFEVAKLYQSIASGGFSMPLRAIEAVSSAKGEPLSSYAIDSKQAINPAMADWLKYGLQTVVKEGTAKRLGQQFPNANLAGKTGTSDNQRDAWFSGFDDRYLAVVWVGRDDNNPTPFTGGVAAMPIWLNTLKQIGVTPISASTYLQAAPVSDQGELLESHCSGKTYLFIQDWIESERENCDARRINKGEKSWLDWLF